MDALRLPTYTLPSLQSSAIDSAVDDGIFAEIEELLSAGEPISVASNDNHIASRSNAANGARPRRLTSVVALVLALSMAALLSVFPPKPIKADSGRDVSDSARAR